MDHRENAAHDLPHAHGTGPGYETSDAHARPIVIAGVCVVAVTAVVFVVLRGMISALEREEPVAPIVKEEVIPAENSLNDFYTQRAQLHKDETNALSEYTYDRKTGVVIIPIDRAMDLIAERGVPKGKGPKTEAEVIRRDGEKK